MDSLADDGQAIEMQFSASESVATGLLQALATSFDPVFDSFQETGREPWNRSQLAMTNQVTRTLRCYYGSFKQQSSATWPHSIMQILNF